MNIEDFPELEYNDGGSWNSYDWDAVLIPQGNHSYTKGDSERTTAEDFPLVDEITSVVTFWAESPEGYGSQSFLGLLMMGGQDDCMFIDGSCDTTGWDCQAGVQVFYGTLDYLISSVITEENLEHLDVERHQLRVL